VELARPLEAAPAEKKGSDKEKKGDKEKK